MAQLNSPTSHTKHRDLSLAIRSIGIDKALPAMRVSVIYNAIEYRVSMEVHGDEHVFRFRIQEKYKPDCQLNAYALRDWFERIDSPEEAFDFLRLGGGFPGTEVPSAAPEWLVTWTEFKRWQSLVRKLRLLRPSESFPLFGVQMPELKDLFMSHEFWSDEPMEMREQIWNAQDQTFFWIQGIPTNLSIERDRFLTRRRNFAEIFSAPGAHIPDSKAWNRCADNSRAASNSTGDRKPRE